MLDFWSDGGREQVRRTPVKVALDGDLVNGVSFCSSLKGRRAAGWAYLVIDERGGYRFHGTLYTAGRTDRNVRCTCRLSYGSEGAELTLRSPRWTPRPAERWEWDRTWDPRIRDHFEEIRATGSITCTIHPALSRGPRD